MTNLLLTAIVCRDLPGSVFFSQQAFDDFAPTARLEYAIITEYQNSDRTADDEYMLGVDLGDLGWSQAAIAAIVANPNSKEHTSSMYNPPAGFLPRRNII